MLLEFSVSNYKSFFQRQTLSLEAQPEVTTLPRQVYAHPQAQILNAALLFGNTGSGKTALLEALRLLKTALCFDYQSNFFKQVDFFAPFLWCDGQHRQPIEFELCFVEKHYTYRYGLGLNKKNIAHEWLFRQTNKEEEQLLFLREANRVEFGAAWHDARGLEPATHAQIPFVAALRKYHIAPIRALYFWLNRLEIIPALPLTYYPPCTARVLNDKRRRHLFFRLLEAADLNIKEVSIAPSAPNSLSAVDIFIHQPAFTSQGTPHGLRRLNVLTQTATGTRALVCWLLTLLDATWQHKVLVTDNFGQHLHPTHALALLDFFQRHSQKERWAQWLLSTRIPKLLEASLWRRDQVHWLECDVQGATTLTTLSEFREEPPLTSSRWEADYFKGRYGALPILGRWRDEIRRF